MPTSEVKSCMPSPATAMATAEKKDLTVFYDGACPYCRTEIKWYKILDKKNTIRWIDITCDKAMLENHNIDYSKAMSELHVMSSDGQYHIGVAGFFVLWSRLPFYRLVSSVLRRFPFVVRLLNKGYKIFAVWRMQRKSKRLI